MLSHVSLLKLVLEIHERIQILQKILPQKSGLCRLYKAFQFLSDKEIEKLQKKFTSFVLMLTNGNLILGFLTTLDKK